MRQKPPVLFTVTTTHHRCCRHASGGLGLDDGSHIMRGTSAREALAIVWPVLREERRRLTATGAASLAINLLHLAAPVYALYVLQHLEGAGRSGLLATATLAVMIALMAQIVLVEVRRRLLNDLAARVKDGVSLPAGPEDRPAQGEDLRALLGVFGGRAGAVLCDLPWIVLFLAASFWLDGALGLFVLCTTMASVLILALSLRRFGRGFSIRREDGRRIAPVWGMALMRAVTLVNIVTALTGCGAFALALALDTGRFTAAGVAIAAALVASRSVSLIRSAVVVAPDVLRALEAGRRLRAALASMASPSWMIGQGPPRRSLRVDDLTTGPAGSCLSMHMRLSPGDAIAIVAPSGVGKSILAACLAGRMPPRSGRVLLDGVSLERWGAAIQRHVGFLPQDPALGDGTIADAIRGLAGEVHDDDVIAAASEAGVHEAIVELPNGYATRVGTGAPPLAAGFRQRIALARALFGRPFLLVLDDPAARLDAAGEAALAAAITRVRARGGIVVSLHQRAPAAPAFGLQAVVTQGRIRIVKSVDAPEARSEAGLSLILQRLAASGSG